VKGLELSKELSLVGLFSISFWIIYCIKVYTYWDISRVFL